MKVLHVIYSASPRRGGPFTSLGSFVAAGRTVGIDAEVLTTDVEEDRPRGWAREVPIRFAHAFPKRGYPLSPEMWRELRTRAAEFDLLHVHGLWRFHGLAAARQAGSSGLPMILRTCGHLAPRTLARSRLRKRLYFSLFERRVLARASLLHFTTEAEREVAARVTPLGDSVVVPPAVVPPPLPPREQARRDLSVPAGARLLVSVARLDPIKRHDLLVEALARLPEETSLALVGGDAGALARVRRIADEAGVGGRLRLAGMAGREDVGRWLAAADVFVSASEHENFGMSIAEAAMCGLPVIAPADLYIAADLRPQLMTAERSPRGFAEAVSALFAEGSLRSRGEGLREKAIRAWSLEAVGGRLLDAYRSAISRRSTSTISRTRSVSK